MQFGEIVVAGPVEELDRDDTKVSKTTGQQIEDLAHTLSAAAAPGEALKVVRVLSEAANDVLSTSPAPGKTEVRYSVEWAAQGEEPKVAVGQSQTPIGGTDCTTDTFDQVQVDAAPDVQGEDGEDLTVRTYYRKVQGDTGATCCRGSAVEGQRLQLRSKVFEGQFPGWS